MSVSGTPHYPPGFHDDSDVNPRELLRKQQKETVNARLHPIQQCVIKRASVRTVAQSTDLSQIGQISLAILNN